MKTDRRHALQTNWLADHLGRWLDKVKPYSNHILAGLCVVAVGLIVWQIFAWVSRNSEQTAWEQLDKQTSGVSLNKEVMDQTAADRASLTSKQNLLNDLAPPTNNDPQSQKEHQQKVKELQDEIAAIRQRIISKQTALLAAHHEELCRLAEKNIRTVAGRAAAFTAASKDLQEGTETLLTDPVGARDKLDRAEKFFQLVKDNASDKLLRQRAQLQLARLYETRLKRDPQHSENDDIAKAKREYEELVKQDPSSYCKAEAQQRLSALTDPKNPLYDWMSRELQKQIDEGGKVKLPATPPPDPDAE